MITCASSCGCHYYQSSLQQHRAPRYLPLVLAVCDCPMFLKWRLHLQISNCHSKQAADYVLPDTFSAYRGVQLVHRWLRVVLGTIWWWQRNKFQVPGNFVADHAGCWNSSEQEALTFKLGRNIQNRTGLWRHIQPAVLLYYNDKCGWKKTRVFLLTNQFYILENSTDKKSISLPHLRLFG